MKFTRIVFLFLLSLLLLTGCVTSPNMQRINVSSNVSSQILNLRNSGNGNTSTTTADRVMKNGFLSAGEEYGYYTLYLSAREAGSSEGYPHNFYNAAAPGFGGLTLGTMFLLGAPTEILDFILSVRLDILDSNSNIIRSYSDSATITKAAGLYYSGDSTNKASSAFSRLIGNVQRRASADSTSINTALRATGPIETRQGGREPQQNDIVGALDNAARVVMASLQERNLINVKIAIVNISTPDREQAVFVAGELEHILVQNRFTIVDRSELDRIRREQNFQLSGDVDDDQIVSIGKFAGADLVITGSITGSGSMRRLRLRVLDTQTAELRGSASEPF